MRTNRTLSLGLSSLAMAGMLASCDLMPAQDGFEKVAYRKREEIGTPARPNPPPVVAGIGEAGGGAVATLPANAPAGVTQAMVEEGQQAYGTVCTACHGPGGAGSPAGPQLNDDQWLNISGSYEEIVTVINNGVQNPKQYPGGMPPRGGGNFNDEQVRALAAYVFAISHQ